ncbi:CPBP family glutamic-type intramembrane protease [Salipiger aestuarii]|uniref:CPBP family glutamic-type intramembrane protease n=1 Tax=Salipiger aestuarii TaxID=568098 RepID=UPI00025B69D3|nr:CPBP family glutamic-type intramembrane protease [Salipiger aestuarii]EIE51842.1 abortive infection protein [Citreicella sp. 357]KAA8611446.1 CAAX protease [Salipiger aestuarii]
MSYAPFKQLTDAAVRPELSRLALGLGVVVALTFGLGQAIMAVARLLLGPDRFDALLGAMQRGDTAIGVYALLLGAGAMGLAVLLAARLVHGRAARSLLGPLPLALRQFARVVVALAVLQAVIFLAPPWSMAMDMLPAMAPARWVALLPLTLLALGVQTGSEELLFRGYLQSQLGARIAAPAVWLVVPSGLFALGHWAPGIYGENAVFVVFWAFLFGLAAADLTARSGTLGPALALHLLNNLSAVAIAAPQGPMTGLALYVLPLDVADAGAVRAALPVDLGVLGLSWLAARLALRV